MQFFAKAHIMEFCPKCENLMLVTSKKKVKFLQCTSCGFEMPFTDEHKELYTLVHAIEHGAKDKTHIAEIEAGPTVTDDDREQMDDDIDFVEE